MVALGAIRAMAMPHADRAAFAVLLVPTLGLVGALAAACFVKVQGTVFLGHPRTPEAGRAHESPAPMLVPMAILAAACAAIGALPALLVAPLARGAAVFSRVSPADLEPAARAAASSAQWVSGAALFLLAMLAGLWLVRRWAGAGTVPSETWGCGYARPTPRMSYGASSFAQILTGGFRWALQPRIRFAPPRGVFPTGARFSTESREAVLDMALVPAVRGYVSLTSRLRRFVAGRLHLQALLVLATLVALLAWRHLWW
jgi:NADH:ubiquinone oxidoreductase subunit 5 (subunit L)/multisubunit Na+/H+ antiporter MnhA subunit